MNAGAYDGDIGSLVDWVETLDLEAVAGAAREAVGGAGRRPSQAGVTAPAGAGQGQAPPSLPGAYRIGRQGLAFGYRKSALQAPGRYAVTRVKINLAPGDPGEILARMAEFGKRRRLRQPLEYPSAGSFFMRPKAHYAGPMIEDCGLKGYSVGGAMVSPRHANFIVNVGNATSADVLAVARHVQETVHARYGIWLEPEVRIIGEPARLAT
jgi:UDP-N-acetylenolpyruvoylglucosamine reductase